MPDPSSVLTNLGLLPAHPYSLYYPLIVLGLWLLFLPLAFLKGIRIFYAGSLRAAFVEEFVYRGLVYGGALYLWHNHLYAVLVSSLFFGIVHMRNIWWAGWKRSWHTSLYAGLRGGPLFGALRWLTGDIYLGILIHFLHNLVVMLPPPGMGHKMAPTPKDAELREKSQR